MSVSAVLAILVGVLVAGGVILLLERSLTRVLLGAVLLGNGINVMILAMGGVAKNAPIIGQSAKGDQNDPLPQVMILTSIVITFAMTAFLLALAYRSWQLQGHDEVQDDVEDRLVATRREAEELEDTGADADLEAAEDARAAVEETPSPDDDAALTRDA
ncbi:Na(+)/H(+) antiporter subunit C [Patulibacter minatonensis]|uniref:Na(+)/H(+) antiporter subunit C n=1 Tax=Patulibacter minatonensis TaxID=298163 RepID=UPI000479C0D2|nr:Na(+)/H(+) antiporter subunit C [Patulibacter minatonensis]